jgi:hypothetical protein
MVYIVTLGLEGLKREEASRVLSSVAVISCNYQKNEHDDAQQFQYPGFCAEDGRTLFPRNTGTHGVTTQAQICTDEFRTYCNVKPRFRCSCRTQGDGVPRQRGAHRDCPRGPG